MDSCSVGQTVNTLQVLQNGVIYSALQVAAAHNNAEAVRLLLRYTANINFKVRVCCSNAVFAHLNAAETHIKVCMTFRLDCM